MRHLTFTSLFIAGLIGASMTPAMAQSSSQKDAMVEMERQLREMGQQNRLEDVKIINAQQDEVIKQIKSGRVDLQAILDNYHYNDPNGKFYGQARGEGLPITSAPSLPQSAAPPISPAQIPAQNRPVAAYSVLEKSWSGFPAQLTYTPRVSYVFPNGRAVNCANWDLREFEPTSQSIGQASKECEVTRGTPDGKALNGFSKGQAVDIRFGNVGAASYGQGSSISGSTLVMTPEGRIAIGKYNAMSIRDGGNSAGGGNRRRALSGTYALDGHLITIVTDEGETRVGFASWTSDKGNRTMDHIYINSEHFWDRSK